LEDHIFSVQSVRNIVYTTTEVNQNQKVFKQVILFLVSTIALASQPH